MEFIHRPVMPAEVLEGLNIRPGGVYVDCTLGGGGHSEAILKELSSLAPGGRLVALDRDPDALAAAAERLAPYKSRINLVRSNFSDLGDVLNRLGFDKVDGVLFDLGVSSYQLDNPSRGFSYQHDAPLDMRMDPDQQITAGDIVNKLPVDELARIIKTYGEERWAARIAEFIAGERKKHPVKTTRQLVEIIKRAVPSGARRQGPHPARRTFQALRIAVNKELEVLGDAVRSAVYLLRSGGRVCVITFHSLEDRIVKEAFRRLAAPCTCPRDFPVCVCGEEKIIRIIAARPVVPSGEEMKDNPRARSAKLRVAEKI